MATRNPARKAVEGQVVYLMIYGPGFKNIQLVVGLGISEPPTVFIDQI